MKGFIDFIKEQGIVGLAIGFILGGSVTAVVTSLVQDIINPIVGILLGSVGNFGDAVLIIAGAKIQYGHFIGVLINFVIIASIVFFIFKQLADKLDKKK
ncbi:hypothetical protein A2V49_01325 [candidate division WWE3 bacterium RBG_19FT_COMBO_34_6]|uniref:Mechanosensitive ion channel protein MscL n=1 Tax=candidate division WWE3 bacterium RBG_19FT_COMBO_34_6 TaxID=1802612 RepID=A0A1F4UJV8_UNCKA|nr:MAG: hypothetical protein A2V49_01325 [candidate division WWE3 bacterium RBG_19FT_COMBO_34_6]